MLGLAASAQVEQAATCWYRVLVVWEVEACHSLTQHWRLARCVYVQNPIQSARLRTAESFHFKYGRVEVKAKLPRGDWLWPVRAVQCGVARCSSSRLW